MHLSWGQKFAGVKKLNLNGSHNDPTMVREKLFYDIWNGFGMPTRRNAFAKLFINEEYMGLYINLEQYDKEWLEEQYEDPNGNLYKCTYPANLVFEGSGQQVYKDLLNSTASGGRVYDLKTNELEDDYSGLVNLISVLDQSPNAAFEAEIQEILNVPQCLKAMAIEVICGHWDNYIYNKNNFYLYQNPSSGKFDFLSYDTDNSFGVDWVGEDWANRDVYNWTESDNRPLYTLLMARPSFRNIYTQYLDSLATYMVNPTIIFPHIDSLQELVSGAAELDAYASLDFGYTYYDFNFGFEGTVDGHTPYGIKPFLEQRIASLNLVVADEVPFFQTKNVTITPNPTENLLFVDCLPCKVGEVEYQILDMNDVFVSAGVWFTSTPICVYDISAGIYCLQLKTENEIYSTRFAVVK